MSRGQIWGALHSSVMHCSLPAGNQITWQAEPLVAATVDISHQLVDASVVSAGRQLDSLLEWVATGQQTAQTQERTTS